MKLAGDVSLALVIAAAVILDENNPVEGLTDSKKISDKKRRILAAQIRLKAKDWAIGRSEPSEIDRINIHQASLLAMRRAFLTLSIKPDYARVDGKFYPDLPCPGETIVQGDSLIDEISAASILAKVSRDDEMLMFAQLYPGYGFEQHKRLSHTLAFAMFATKRHHAISSKIVRARQKIPQ